MKLNLILKVSILVFALFLVILVRNSASKGSFADSINALFGSNSQPKLNWCAEHVVDVAWINANIPEKLKQLDLPRLRNNYCELTTEAIEGVDLDKITWEPLAESTGAAGQKTTLLWNKDHSLFKSGGLPFKSSKLSRELVDK